MVNSQGVLPSRSPAGTAALLPLAGSGRACGSVSRLIPGQWCHPTPGSVWRELRHTSCRYLDSNSRPRLTRQVSNGCDYRYGERSRDGMQSRGPSLEEATMFFGLKTILRSKGDPVSRRTRRRCVPSIAVSASCLEDRMLLSGAAEAASAHHAAHHFVRHASAHRIDRATGLHAPAAAATAVSGGMPSESPTISSSSSAFNRVRIRDPAFVPDQYVAVGIQRWFNRTQRETGS